MLWEREEEEQVVFSPQVGDTCDWLQNTTVYSLAPLTDSFAPISDRRKLQRESHEFDLHQAIYLKLDGCIDIILGIGPYCY